MQLTHMFKLWVLGSSPRRPTSHSRWRMRSDPESRRCQKGGTRDHPLNPMNWYVYIAQCRSGSLYTGVALDPVERLASHNAGRGSAYVRSRGGASLLYVERYATKSSALRREHEIKSWRRRKKLSLIGRMLR